jgi:hypothetical protein
MILDPHYDYLSYTEIVGLLVLITLMWRFVVQKGNTHLPRPSLFPVISAHQLLTHP